MRNASNAISHRRAIRDFPWLWALGRVWGDDMNPHVHARVASRQFLEQAHPGIATVHAYYVLRDSSVRLVTEVGDGRHYNLAARVPTGPDCDHLGLAYIVTEQSPGSVGGHTIAVYRAPKGDTLEGLVEGVMRL